MSLISSSVLETKDIHETLDRVSVEQYPGVSIQLTGRNLSVYDLELKMIGSYAVEGGMKNYIFSKGMGVSKYVCSTCACRVDQKGRIDKESIKHRSTTMQGGQDYTKQFKK